MTIRRDTVNNSISKFLNNDESVVEYCVFATFVSGAASLLTGGIANLADQTNIIGITTEGYLIIIPVKRIIGGLDINNIFKVHAKKVMFDKKYRLVIYNSKKNKEEKYTYRPVANILSKTSLEKFLLVFKVAQMMK